MNYTELQILDYMKEQKTVDVNLIFFYIEVLPNYRSAIMPRHNKFIKSLKENYGSISLVAQEFEYGTEGIGNVLRKIQTCMYLQYNEFIKDGKQLPKYNPFKNYIPINPNKKRSIENDEPKVINQIKKSEQILKLEALIHNNPEWYYFVQDTIQRNLVRLLINGEDYESIEKKLGISRDTIYRKVFKRNSNSVFDILNKK